MSTPSKQLPTITDFEDASVEAPGPAELATLAIMLYSTGLVAVDGDTTAATPRPFVVSKDPISSAKSAAGNSEAPQNPADRQPPHRDPRIAAAVKLAASWWIESRLRCEKLVDFEIRLAAYAGDIQVNGDKKEKDVMKMVGMKTPSHFRKRVEDFFNLDWEHPPKWLPDLDRRRLKTNADRKATIEFLASENGGLTWHTLFAEIFARYIKLSRSKTSVTGGRARHGLGRKNAAEG